jgi:hypothetical protein
MSDAIKHECGIALIRLKKPLSFYQEKIWHCPLRPKQTASSDAKAKKPGSGWCRNGNNKTQCSSRENATSAEEEVTPRIPSRIFLTMYMATSTNYLKINFATRNG